MKIISLIICCSLYLVIRCHFNDTPLKIENVILIASISAAILAFWDQYKGREL